MKQINKLVLIAMAIITFASCDKEKEVDYTVLSGTIANVGQLNKIVVRGADFNQEIKLNKDGSFLDTLKTPSGYYALIMGRDGMYVFLQTGDHLKISSDANNFSGAVKYESGETKGVNEYLMAKNKSKQELMQKIGGSQIFTLPEAGFLKIMDSIKNIDISLLKETKNLPSNFVNLESKKINYEYLQNVIMYPKYFEYFNKGKDFEPSEDLKKIMASVDYTNADDYKNLGIYKQMVLSHFFEKFQEEGADKKAVVAEVKKAGIPALSKDFAETIASGITTNTPNLDETVTLIRTLTNDKELLSELDVKVAQMKQLSAGNPSPNFAYNDINGKKVSLSDLKGNLVYIDVWATWCGPCKREIPFLKEIEEAYHGKAIKFVSISVDTDKGAWEKMVKDKNMGGIQLYADGNWKAEFVEAYGIKGIPRFILIDKAGNILNANAPRPSSGEELTKLIDENLK